jgi:ABC-type glycerol-3-phosphate transport system substrate-binding protein
MKTRRDLLAFAAASAVASLAGPALAAQPVVEVLSMSHWPVREALKPVMDVLARYQGRVQVKQMDIEGDDGVKRLKSIGLKGHIPIVLMIDGARTFKRADGSNVEFLNFPAAANNPMGLNGAWGVSDFEDALKAALGEKN